MALAALLTLVLLLGRWSMAPAPTNVDPVSVRTPTLGAAMPRERPTPLSERSPDLHAALARAVAAIGAYDDGRRATLDDLAPEVLALVEHARLLLGTTPRIAAPGLPMQLPDGTLASMGPDPAPRRPPESDRRDTDGTATTPAGRERARAVDGRLVARTLTRSGKAPPPTRGDLVKEILEPDAWMAIPYDPARVAGEPLALTNRSLGEYVLRLDAGDYGSVRLNGGLVVPGRFYLMQGTMTISGDVPVGVIIRPLGVVHGYHEQPVRPPSANG